MNKVNRAQIAVYKALKRGEMHHENKQKIADHLFILYGDDKIKSTVKELIHNMIYFKAVEAKFGSIPSVLDTILKDIRKNIENLNKFILHDLDQITFEQVCSLMKNRNWSCQRQLPTTLKELIQKMVDKDTKMATEFDAQPKWHVDRKKFLSNNGIKFSEKIHQSK